MAREVFAFAVTIPAGTAIATPQVTPLTIPPRIVERIEVKVPPGPRGNVGFQLGMANRQLIPYNAGGFVIADDDDLSWDFESLPTSGAWQLLGYNLGLFPHTLYVRLLTQLPAAQVAAPLAQIPADQLGSDAGQLASPDGVAAGGNGVALPPPPDLGSPPPLPASLPPPPDVPPPLLPDPGAVPPPVAPGVQPYAWPGPPSWPLSGSDLTGIES